VNTQFSSEHLKGIYHMGDLVVDGRIILKLISEKRSVNGWTKFNWLRLWSSGGILCAR